MKVFVTCVSVVLLAALAFGGYCIAAEAAEYSEAHSFFSENDLSLADLSRAEIKEVYKDIKSEAFEHEKTAEVLNNLLLKLYSARLNLTDKEDIKFFWENRLNYDDYLQTAISYSGTYEHFDTEPYVRMVISCYNGEEWLWDYTVNCDVTLRSIRVENGEISYGVRDSRGSSTGYAYAFMLDYSVNVVWEYVSEDEGSAFDVAVKNGDDIAFFGSDWHENSLCNTIFYLLDNEGNKKISNKIPTTSYVSYDSAIKLSDKYLVKDDSKIYEFSFDGECMREFSIKEGDIEYDIIDMKYYDGKVWFSTYIDVDYYEEELAEITAIRHEYFAEWDKLGYDPGFTGERKERYTEFFRSTLEATLFVFDENGVIEKVHSIPGAIPCGDLEKDEKSNIVLTVYRIDEAEPPFKGTSVRCIFAVLTEFRLVFDSEEQIVQTNEVQTHPRRQFIY